ncbi:MAG: anti-sigma factor family protein [Bacteroidota bacterium]
MNECKKIEPLLFLYREGEVSSDEKSRVNEHLKSCRSCNTILRELKSMDAALQPVRNTVPVLSDDAARVTDTLNIITGKSAGNISGNKKFSIIDFLIGWMQPALRFAVAAGIVLFIIQQSRDAMKITHLENNLQTDGNTAMAENSFIRSVTVQLLDLLPLQRRTYEPFSSTLNTAGIGSDPTKLFGNDLLALLRQNGALFDEFSKKYPNLAKININDGIDEREKKILETEGVAFMKDFEQLLKEGKK